MRSNSIIIFGFAGLIVAAWFLLVADHNAPRDIGRPTSPYSTLR